LRGGKYISTVIARRAKPDEAIPNMRKVQQSNGKIKTGNNGAKPIANKKTFGG
jgi:hypothetical protein